MTRFIAAALAASVVLAPIAAVAAPKDDMTAKDRMERQSQRITKQFDRLDANKDGVLDRTEAETPLVRVFGKLDKNRDGVLDASEIKAVRDARKPRPEGAALKGRRGGDRFERADANQDGKVAKEEFLATPLPWFVRADADKDEKVTKAELTDFLAKRSARAGKAGARGKAKPADNAAPADDTDPAGAADDKAGADAE